MLGQGLELLVLGKITVRVKMNIRVSVMLGFYVREGNHWPMFSESFARFDPSAEHKKRVEKGGMHSRNTIKDHTFCNYF